MLIVCTVKQINSVLLAHFINNKYAKSARTNYSNTAKPIFKYNECVYVEHNCFMINCTHTNLIYVF